MIKDFEDLAKGAIANFFNHLIPIPDMVILYECIITSWFEL